MPSLKIRAMQPNDEPFVASCTHVGETDEWDASGRRRVPWLREMQAQGRRPGRFAIRPSAQVRKLADRRLRQPCKVLVGDF